MNEDFPAAERKLGVEIPPTDRHDETPEDVALHQYEKRRKELEARLNSLRSEEETREQLLHTRRALGLATQEDGSEHRHREIEALEEELIRAQADYPGHWTLLLKERLTHPEIRAKFMAVREDALSSLKEGVPGPLDRKKEYQSHYENQISEYDTNLDTVFASTQIGNATAYGKRSISLGRGNIGEPGVVFLDAENLSGEPLTPRQMAIIEAHEKGHGMRDFHGTDKAEIRSVLDADMLRDRESRDNRFANYLQQPEEIIERMSQLKNYFGFKGNELFTKKHLEYAREHYVNDTGLDNRMSDFFAAITPETEDHFIEVMNKYPI